MFNFLCFGISSVESFDLEMPVWLSGTASHSYFQVRHEKILGSIPRMGTSFCHVKLPYRGFVALDLHYLCREVFFCKCCDWKVPPVTAGCRACAPSLQTCSNKQRDIHATMLDMLTVHELENEKIPDRQARLMCFESESRAAIL